MNTTSEKQQDLKILFNSLQLQGGGVGNGQMVMATDSGYG